MNRNNIVIFKPIIIHEFTILPEKSNEYIVPINLNEIVLYDILNDEIVLGEEFNTITLLDRGLPGFTYIGQL